MSRMKAMMLMAATMAAAAYRNPYEERPRGEQMSFNPNYRPKPVRRELREFTVKGQKIMAYSKKDAVTKLRHQKK
jgi:hypothetical protein